MSALPAAAELAQRCFDAYLPHNPDLPPELRANLEPLADYFFLNGNLVSVFIRALVPWGDLVGPPNDGHEAVADLLLTGAMDHAVTTNFDFLVERAAWDLGAGADFSSSLNVNEIVVQAATHSPLVKLHGCGFRKKDETLWTRQQLELPPFAASMPGLREWLSVNLREKDLVIVGYWSDWPHLTDTIEQSLRVSHPAHITLVDLAAPAQLEARAPALWDALHAPDTTFEHVQMSADVFLCELREAYSRVYIRRLFQLGGETYQEFFHESCPPEWLRADDIPSEDLYALRRDAEGQPDNTPARARMPNAECEQVAFYQLALRRRGGQREGTCYRLGERRIRVVNGHGQSLGKMKAKYSREPNRRQIDLVACIGAVDYGVPENIVRGDPEPSVVRSAAQGEWLDGTAAWALLEG